MKALRYLAITFVVLLVLWSFYSIASAKLAPAPAFIASLILLVQTFIAIVGGLYGAILTHELGHYVFGRLAGFQMVAFTVGPLQLTKRGVRRVGANGRVAGFVLMAPRDSSEATRRRYAVMIAGGPIASVLCGLGLFAFLSLNPTFWTIWLYGLIFMWSMSGLLMGFVNLLPIRVEGLMLDGALLRAFLTRSPESERTVAIMALSGLSLSGTRPRDLPQDLLARAASVPDGTPHHAIALDHLAWAKLDSGDKVGAVEHAKAALAGITEKDRFYFSTVCADVAVVAAFGGDLELARQAYDRIEPERVLMAKFGLPRAEAALLFAGGQFEEAVQAARKTLAAMERDPIYPPESLAFSTELMEEIINAGEAARLQPAAV